MNQKHFTKKALFGVCLMMIFGSFTMVANKLLLKTDTRGFEDNEGETSKFDKTIYASLVMFFGMAFCYPWYEITQIIDLVRHPPSKSSNLSLNAEDDQEQEQPKQSFSETAKNYCLMVIPATCDLVSTTVMTTGMIYIDASIVQMLRGSLVIFSALTTIIFLRRKLLAYQWVGVLLVLVAIVIVGLASVIKPTDDDEDDEYSEWYYKFLGVILVLVSQVITALQIVVEEVLLSNVHLPPMVVVGMEGWWGLILCVFVFIPIFQFIPGSQNDHYEDTWDTFYRVFNSSKLIGFSVLYWISILFLNYGGMVVTSELTAVHRTIFEALRTFFIWLVQLFIFYVISEDYGEEWTNYSFMQLGGFLVLVCGMLVYNRVIKLPKFDYPEIGAPAEPAADDTSKETQPLLE